MIICLNVSNSRLGADGTYLVAELQATAKPDPMPLTGEGIEGMAPGEHLDAGSRLVVLEDGGSKWILGQDMTWYEQPKSTGEGGGGTVSVEVADTVTRPAGSLAVVENIGTAQNVRLRFEIPQGLTGKTGEGIKDNLTGAPAIFSAPGVDSFGQTYTGSWAPVKERSPINRYLLAIEEYKSAPSMELVPYDQGDIPESGGAGLQPTIYEVEFKSSSIDFSTAYFDDIEYPEGWEPGANTFYLGYATLVSNGTATVSLPIHKDTSGYPAVNFPTAIGIGVSNAKLISMVRGDFDYSEVLYPGEQARLAYTGSVLNANNQVEWIDLSGGVLTLHITIVDFTTSVG